jgi:hypothetical protein
MENITISPEQPKNDHAKKTWVEPELTNFNIEGGLLAFVYERDNGSISSLS